MDLEILSIIFVCVLLFLDSRQTLDIKNHPNLHEINVILGKHPSDSKIIAYFFVATAFFAYIADYLFTNQSIEYFWMWVGGWSAMELWCLINNKKLGLKI